MKVGFIGAGNMAGAIIRGMVSGGFRGGDVLAYDVDSAKLMALFEDCGIRMCSSGREVAEEADAVVLAVKATDVRRGTPPAWLRLCTGSRPLVIAIAAGKTLPCH